MNIFSILLILSIMLIQHSTVFASETKEQSDYKQQCISDLDYIRKQMQDNSAPFKNSKEIDFKAWFENGYDHSKELIQDIRTPNDCYYVIKFYLNGFENSYISLRGLLELPAEKYPGFLTAKYGDNHIVIYKHSGVAYLNKINVGDVVTNVNELTIDKYFNDYILPFYSNDSSEFSVKAASVYDFIINDNPFVPIPLTATFKDDEKEEKIALQYTALTGEALLAARNIRQPDSNRAFKVKVISDGVWITIPSFYLNTEESVFYTGMLSKLRELARKEEYIVFDLRGNRGGAAKWSRPIIRNLWGDEYIKSLGKNHDYNSTWIKKIRVSKKNMIEFRRTANAAEVKNFTNAMKNGEDYFEKKWNVYDEDLNLYTNKDNTSVKAKIYVLTDHFCRSTCFAFVSELLQIPGVTHIGLATAVQSNDSYARKDRTPSEHFDFFYPTEIRVYPNRNLGKALVPSILFNGDIRDDTAVINWVLSITEAKEE